MSRRTQALELAPIEQEHTAEEIATMEQAWNSFILTQAKELVCELWKQGRITMDVYSEGGAALSAARHAVENPEIKNLSLVRGAILSNEQWLKEQEAKNREF